MLIRSNTYELKAAVEKSKKKTKKLMLSRSIHMKPQKYVLIQLEIHLKLLHFNICINSDTKKNFFISKMYKILRLQILSANRTQRSCTNAMHQCVYC